MNAFGMAFLAAILAAASLRFWLGTLHMRHGVALRGALPAEFTV